MPVVEHTNHRATWWRSTPAIAIAVLALIVSTAGGAYAVGKNSVGSKQLKKNAVSSSKIKDNSIQSSDVKSNTIQSSDVKNGSLTAGDFAPGQLPPMPAASSRIYFVTANDDGALVAKSPGVTTVTKVATGTYYVDLSFDASKCAPVVSLIDAGASAGVISISNRATVTTFAAGHYADRRFSLIIAC